jgi:hypothetical protein
MKTTTVPGRRLTVLLLICLAGLLFSLSLWVINLEMAIRVFAPEWKLFENLLPPGWFAFGLLFAVDLSTISTLVPVLLFLFPLVQAWRVGHNQKQESDFAANLEADPYPPHFAFFLVMLGLVGTLYGLMIGLDLSGVSDLAGQPLSQDAIRRSLDRLLGGTATALLSSLVGILGAFVAARPMAWCFRRTVGIRPDVRRRGLSETVTHVTGELNALGEASRSFAKLLNPAVAETVLDRLHAQSTALEQLASSFSESNQRLERLEALASQNTNAITQAISLLKTDVERSAIAAESVVEKMTELIGIAQTGNGMLSALKTEVSEGNQQRDTLTTALNESNLGLNRIEATAQECSRGIVEAKEAAARQHETVMETATAMLREVKVGRDCLERDQESRRKALSAYISDVVQTTAE